jgi:8-oxo-dGTP pyrophosphatase MutT (NUDIX family)
LNVELPTTLAARLREPLPSWSAQSRYKPEMSFGRHRGPAEVDARPAAVLILLYPRDGLWHVPLIVRPAHMLDHAGQVSFPGGVIEPGETGRQAALREFAEELGVAAAGVEMLGRLSELYLFASNFSIEPWVGVLATRPSWAPNRREVDRVLEIPLAHLLDSAASGRIERRQGPITFHAPCFHFDSQAIWGATSMVLAELLALVAELEM